MKKNNSSNKSNKNISAQITEYLSQVGGTVTAKEINENFVNKGYTQGQVAGALFRLKETGRIVSPNRGEYENTNSSNVVNELFNDIQQLVNKYDQSVPLSIFTALSDKEQETYKFIIKSLTDLTNSRGEY